MKNILHILFLVPFLAISQVGINTVTPDLSSALDISASDKGVLFPQIDLQSQNDISTINNPASSLLVWNTGNTWGMPGYYYNKGTAVTPFWILISSSSIITESITLTSVINAAGAAGTAPTKATNPDFDYISATDDGSGWVVIDFNYTHTTNAGATSGTGDYLFKLPNGFSFDTNTHLINNQYAIVSGSEEVLKFIALNGMIITSSTRSFRNFIVPYDATHFRIVTYDINTWEFLRNGNFSLNGSQLGYFGNFRFKKQQ